MNTKFGTNQRKRPERESNPRMAVLQTAAFPLRHLAIKDHKSLVVYFSLLALVTQSGSPHTSAGH